MFYIIVFIHLDDFDISSLIVDIAAFNNDTYVNISGMEDNIFEGFEDFEIFIESDNLEDVVLGATSTLTLTVINIDGMIIVIVHYCLYGLPIYI